MTGLGEKGWFNAVCTGWVTRNDYRYGYVPRDLGWFRGGVNLVPIRFGSVYTSGIYILAGLKVETSTRERASAA